MFWFELFLLFWNKLWFGKKSILTVFRLTHQSTFYFSMLFTFFHFSGIFFKTYFCRKEHFIVILIFFVLEIYI